MGRTFLDKVAVATANEISRLGGTRVQAKVEASKGGSTGNGGTRGKTYADLPADAKAACASFERDLVGPNRRYKTVAEWHTAYATQHFQEI